MSLPKNHVGLYIHIPVCTGKCPYCAFFSVPLHQVDTEALTTALLTELATYAGISDIHTVYIGGGSPTALPSTQLLSLLKLIQRTWPNLHEVTVECNPGQVTFDRLRQLHDHGVTRLSFGAQSMLDQDLMTLGRRHTVQDIRQAVHWARAAGFDNLSVDLIFAVPGSNLAAWSASLQAVIDLDVPHISTYSLTYEPDTPFNLARQTGDLQPVDETLDRTMYETAIDTLQLAGYEHYEISNFARPGFACQHNLGYWANRPFIGIGPAAASYWRDQRTVNISDTQAYIQAVRQGQSPVEKCEKIDVITKTCETAVLNLRLRQGINRQHFYQNTGQWIEDLFAREIIYHQQLQNLTVTDQAVRLSEQALPIADRVLCDFACL